MFVPGLSCIKDSWMASLNSKQWNIPPYATKKDVSFIEHSKKKSSHLKLMILTCNWFFRRIPENLGYHFMSIPIGYHTWRIFPFSHKWLISMVNVRPRSRVSLVINGLVYSTPLTNRASRILVGGLMLPSQSRHLFERNFHGPFVVEVWQIWEKPV